MKFLSLIFLTILLSFSAFSSDRVSVKATKVSCEQLKDLLNEHGSIWIKSPIFPLLEKNIAISRPVCSGSRNHPQRVCRWFQGSTRTKTGKCKLGTECSCRTPSNNDDD